MTEHEIEPHASVSLWTEARFPNAVMRTEFLEQVRLWNRIEDLPRIQAQPGDDGTALRYWCADYRREGLRKLVRSYGGTVTLEPRGAERLDHELLATAFDCC
jgi:hypothetical protein